MTPFLTPILAIVGKVVDRIIPDKNGQAQAKAEIELALMQEEAKLLEGLLKSDLAQAEINKIEAGSESKFKSWWRPACAWICVAGFAWAGFLQPILEWSMAVLQYTVATPKFPIEVLMNLLFGLLGLGAYRSYDKRRNK